MDFSPSGRYSEVYEGKQQEICRIRAEDISHGGCDKSGHPPPDAGQKQKQKLKQIHNLNVKWELSK